MIEDWAPSRDQLTACRLFALAPGGDPDQLLEQACTFESEVSVVLDPGSFRASALASLQGVTLGVIPEPPSSEAAQSSCAALDRILAFDPALSGTAIGDAQVWRAIPPPVSDILFAEARSIERAPRAMSIGPSTAHREAMLMPAKHEHDLLEIVHGVNGAQLAALLAEYDVGVYVAEAWGGAFGWPAAAHLAAAHLLISESLRPAHGLEENIDYLRVEAPEDLLAILSSLRDFPEAHRRMRIRGRMKAEQFRASRTFRRIVHDLLLDVAAFGRKTPGCT